MSNKIDCTVAVAKKCLVLNIGEMMKCLGVASLSERQLGKVPVLQFVRESGDEEDAFVFDHPDHPFHKACVRRCRIMKHNSTAMGADSMSLYALA